MRYTKLFSIDLEVNDAVVSTTTVHQKIIVVTHQGVVYQIEPGVPHERQKST